MIRHRVLLVVIGILGINTSPALALATQLNLTITPGHAHITPGTDLNIMCKADVPLTHCEFKVRGGRVYDLSEGFLTEPDKEFSYFGEGLEKGDCGVTINGNELRFVVYVVGCRARTSTSDWAFAEMALINKRREGLDVTITPSRTVTVLPGDPIQVLADVKKPLTQCTFVLTNDFSKTNNRRRFNFYANTTADAKNPVGTGMEYFGQGVNEGQCGLQVLEAKEEFNDGVWIDLFDTADHEETVFFRLIVARAPVKPTIMYNTTGNVGGTVDLTAWCSVRSRPAAKLSWYLGGERIPDKDLEFIPTLDWKWPSNILTVEQKLTLKLKASDDGKDLWCSADHMALTEARESERVKIKISFPPSTPVLEIISSSFSEGSTLEATCFVEGGQPGARITWYLGDDIIRQDGRDDEPDPSGNIKKGITQKLKHLLKGRENGLELKCEVTHKSLSQPLQATRKVRFNFCSPLASKTVQLSCSLAGEEVDCAEPQQVGTIAQLTCKPGHVVASSVVYRRVVCLRAATWDRPVFTCTPACGRRNTNSGVTLISGGEDSRIGEFPWHIGIYEVRSPNAEPVQTCGGTLISPNMIVSAAHCFWSNQKKSKKDATNVKVAAGKHVRDWVDLDLNVQKRDVRQIIIPLRYTGRTSQFASDIALLRLSVVLEMTATVNLICIDWENQMERFQLKEGNVGVVAGWGYTEHGDQSKMLKYVNLPYVDADLCAAALSAELEPVFTHDKFCAGYVNQSTSVCRGDSGGGLVFRDPGTDKYFLRGIVSIAFTPPSNNAVCYSQLYTGFTKFSLFISWIQEYI